MIQSIIFSKNRPLQLDGLLDSFNYYTDVISDIYIITPEYSDNYNKICNKYNKDGRYVDLITEEGYFYNTLVDLINDFYNDDYILFMVDDLIFHNQFNINIAHRELEKHKDALSFSFRIGTNIHPYTSFWNTLKREPIIKFDWRNKPSHFGYPFEVSASLYRVPVVKEILEAGKGKINIPNDLESFGVNYTFNNFGNKYPYILMNNGPSVCSCLDFNRVQDVYKNKTHGTEQESSENLLKLYQEGYRLDWRQYHGIQPNDPFIGSMGAKLIKI